MDLRSFMASLSDDPAVGIPAQHQPTAPGSTTAAPRPQKPLDRRKDTEQPPPGSPLDALSSALHQHKTSAGAQVALLMPAPASWCTGSASEWDLFVREHVLRICRTSTAVCGGCHPAARRAAGSRGGGAQQCGARAPFGSGGGSCQACAGAEGCPGAGQCVAAAAGMRSRRGDHAATGALWNAVEAR